MSARELEVMRAALQAIADDSGCGPEGNCDEWTEADAFSRSRRIAREALAECAK